MAWVARTARPELFDSSTTPSAVGPGAYNPINSNTKISGAAYAPFSSTTHREVVDLSASNQNTPGPGRYNVKSSVSRKHTFRSVFVDQTSRFQLRTNENPGPGAYEVESSIVVARAKRAFPVKSKQRSIEFVRTAPIPSIPHNSHGFQEEYGVLVPQAALVPKQSHSYEPPSSLSLEHTPVSFARSKTQRSQWQGEQAKHSVKPRTAPSIPRCFGIKNEASPETCVPGPGAYQTEQVFSIGGQRSNIAGDTVVPNSSYLKYKPSAVFLSKKSEDVHTQPTSTGTTNSSIPHKTLQLDEHKKVDRDVMYMPPSIFDKAAQPAPIEKQFFASKTMRCLELGAGSDVPGPGSYHAKDVKPQSFNRNSGTGVFVDKTDRFSTAMTTSAKNAALVPGPGAYDPKELFKKKSFNRNGTFGSTSSRFVPDSDEQSQLGPGAYLGQQQGGEQEKTKTGVAFSTKTARLTYRPEDNSPRRRLVVTQDADAAYRIPNHGFLGARLPGTSDRQNTDTFPSVGTYDIDIDGRKRAELVSNPTNKNFNTKTPRFQNNLELKEVLLKSHLGPGRYDLETHVLQPQAASTSFSKDARFEHVHPNKVPGVGMYDTAPSPLVKKSFNITIQ